jgi:hypothetical protein
MIEDKTLPNVKELSEPPKPEQEANQPQRRQESEAVPPEQRAARGRRPLFGN